MISCHVWWYKINELICRLCYLSYELEIWGKYWAWAGSICTRSQFLEKICTLLYPAVHTIPKQFFWPYTLHVILNTKVPYNLYTTTSSWRKLCLQADTFMTCMQPQRIQDLCQGNGACCLVYDLDSIKGSIPHHSSHLVIYFTQPFRTGFSTWLAWCYKPNSKKEHYSKELFCDWIMCAFQSVSVRVQQVPYILSHQNSLLIWHMKVCHKKKAGFIFSPITPSSW